MIQRLPDWLARLHDFIDSVKAAPFSWEADCALGFAAGAVQAQTGVDLAANLRGRHKTARGAMRTLRSMGVETLADAVALHLPRLEHPSQAQIGDIALIPTDGPFGYALGVFNGETIVAPGVNGMGVLPRTAATQAFKVG